MNVKEYWKEYTEDKREKPSFDYRLLDYEKARRILDGICSMHNISKDNFFKEWKKLTGKSSVVEKDEPWDKKGTSRLWWSTGLCRWMSNEKIKDNVEQIIKMICEIRNNIEKTPEKVFERAQEIKKESNIKGRAVNILTEIMHTYNQKKFPILNVLTITVLGELGIPNISALPEKPNSFTSKDYGKYTSLLKDEVLNKFPIGKDDFGRVDHFFNYIYQLQKERG